MAMAQENAISKIKNDITSQIEQIETNKVKLTITVGKSALLEGLQYAYNENKKYYNVSGFRKGKAPRKMIEQFYGKEVFHEDAINYVVPHAYYAVIEQHNLDTVYQPKMGDMGSINESTGFEFSATVATRPIAEIENYHGITYPKGVIEPTEEQIQAVLHEEQEKNARQVSVNRPSQIGDTLVINFKGFIDDVQFEGGTAENHNLTLGSHSFIDTFEDQLVNREVGDDVTVNVTFPEAYHRAEFAGKPARFEVEILDIQEKQFPEVDDDFAQDVSEFNTMEEYRTDIINKLREQNESSLEAGVNDYILNQLIPLATMEIPEEMYQEQLDDRLESFKNNIMQQGIDIETYSRYTGITPNKLKEQWQPAVETDVKMMLVLEAIARKENIEITDEQFNEQVGILTGRQGDELAKLVSSYDSMRRKELERTLLRSKALEFVKNHGNAIDGPLPSQVKNPENL